MLYYGDEENQELIVIDVHTIKKMVELIEKRPSKLRLKVLLNLKHCTVNIPAELVKICRNTLTLVVGENVEEIYGEDINWYDHEFR